MVPRGRMGGTGVIERGRLEEERGGGAGHMMTYKLISKLHLQYITHILQLHQPRSTFLDAALRTRKSMQICKEVHDPPL